jgi:hypothetical protein
LRKLRQLTVQQNLQDVLDEAADATGRNTRVWGVFGHLGNGGLIYFLIILSLTNFKDFKKRKNFSC